MTTISRHFLIVITIVSWHCIICMGQINTCKQRRFRSGIVCVCNATYCDDVGSVRKVASNQYLVFTSSKSGQRFHRQQLKFQKPGSASVLKLAKLTIKRQEKRQSICGFGGAFTDATGINVNCLSDAAQEKLLRSYFAPEGLEYTMGRVPIGGTDFSTRPYTYDDVKQQDFNLTHFQLQEEDYKYKIPLIKRAQALAGGDLRLFASAWSAPTWMKTNGQLNGRGFLKGKPGGLYYQTWANYHVRFLDEYKKNNITFWGLTSGNEPVNGNIPRFSFNALGFTPFTLGTFIGKNLGPTLHKSGYQSIALITSDDQRLFTLMVPWTLSQNEVNKYVKGIGFHWYLNFLAPPDILTLLHDRYPDKFILATEACEGSLQDKEDVVLGSWERGEAYALDIIEDLTHWSCGWIDWNMALDLIGGPNWVHEYVDSPVIIDSKNDEFYKQPMFYAIGHFSKFLRVNDVIISTSQSTTISGLDSVAATRTDNSTVIVVLNRKPFSRKFLIEDPGGQTILVKIPPNAIQTYVWWSP